LFLKSHLTLEYATVSYLKFYFLLFSWIFKKFVIYLFADCLCRTERVDFLVLSFEIIPTNPCQGSKLLNQIELKDES